MQSAPFPNGMRPFTKQLYDCFFVIPGPRFFIPDTLPIPLPYYWLLVPGFLLALWHKRFEIVLLAIIPVAGAFVARAIENRLLLPIPFWVILMSFTFAGILKLRRMAKHSNCTWRYSSVDTARRPCPIRSLYLQQNQKSIRDSLLRARGGRCLAILKTCCCR